MMISVTVAAQGRSRRCVGTHLRAYGSGRLSICDLDQDSPEAKEKLRIGFWSRLVTKLLDTLTMALHFCFPFLFTPRTETRRLTGSKSNSGYRPVQTASLVNKLNEKCLLNIFQHLDGPSVIKCSTVCKKWKKVIERNREELPKKKVDQLRILFDEGECMIYSADEKRIPTHHRMPNLKDLRRHLKHLCVDSLLVRGLIPVEAIPVLRALVSLDLQPRQIYFIWSKFSLESIQLLYDLLEKNEDTLKDFGLEDCGPTNVLNDDLVEPLLKNLTTLRVWNDGKCGVHDVTDHTIRQIAESIGEGLKVETLDFASCRVTTEAVADLVLAWTCNPTADLSVSVTNTKGFDQEDMIRILMSNGVFVDDDKIRANGNTLTLLS